MYTHTQTDTSIYLYQTTIGKTILFVNSAGATATSAVFVGQESRRDDFQSISSFFFVGGGGSSAKRFNHCLRKCNVDLKEMHRSKKLGGFFFFFL